MDKFRHGATRVLITTNLLARGIDVQQVSIVINYDFPTDKENYLHRIGRSGRLGERDLQMSFISKYDKGKIREVEKFYGTQIQELTDDFDTNI